MYRLKNYYNLGEYTKQDVTTISRVLSNCKFCESPADPSMLVCLIGNLNISKVVGDLMGIKSEKALIASYLGDFVCAGKLTGTINCGYIVSENQIIKIAFTGTLLELCKTVARSVSASLLLYALPEFAIEEVGSGLSAGYDDWLDLVYEERILENLILVATDRYLVVCYIESPGEYAEGFISKLLGVGYVPVSLSQIKSNLDYYALSEVIVVKGDHVSTIYENDGEDDTPIFKNLVGIFELLKK